MADGNVGDGWHVAALIWPKRKGMRGLVGIEDRHAIGGSFKAAAMPKR